MIAGLWANPNYDDNKQTRRRAIDEINERHQEIIRELYDKMTEAEKEAIEQHPFFSAMELDEAPKDTPIPRPHDPQDQKYIQEIDQM